MRKFSAVTALTVLVLLLYTRVNAIGPNCFTNESIYDYRTVTKTRTVIKTPRGFFKFMSRSKTVTEEYEEKEQYLKEWKMIPKCCEGYLMSHHNSCDPVCTKGCPPHSSCVEPNRCHCESEYVSATSTKDGSHYCELICGPNYDFNTDLDKCVPHCKGGCPHGSCVLPELCDCFEGYIPYRGSCQSADEVANRTVSDSDEALDTSTVAVEFDLSASSTEISCGSGFVYFRGDCRSELFGSGELDCKVKACGSNAVCLQNGSCVCAHGFLWQNDGTVCVLSNMVKEENNMLVALLLALVLTIVVGLFVFVSRKFLHCHRGHMDFEAKRETLTCEYGKDSRASAIEVL